MKPSVAPLELQTYPAEVLREICKPAGRFDTELREIVEDIRSLHTHVTIRCITRQTTRPLLFPED